MSECDKCDAPIGPDARVVCRECFDSYTADDMAAGYACGLREAATILTDALAERPDGCSIRFLDMKYMRIVEAIRARASAPPTTTRREKP